MPRRPALAATLPAALLVVGAATSSAQQIVGARDARALRADSVFRRFDRTDSPGCVLGVYQDDRVVYARGYGMASLELGVPLTPRSVLDVGSVSKQFTALAILLLQKDGKLSLDDPVRKYFPEMPAYADRVTLRRALSQTSGLRDIYGLMSAAGRSFDGDTVDALRLITRSAEPNFEPGARYLYTNSGWILAAQLVYRLTGKTLQQFAAERMFEPLGMRDTRYMDDRGAVIPNRAEGYAPGRNGGFRVQRSQYDGSIMGAGGIHTSVEDFGRWLRNYEEGTVGGRDIFEMMTTATRLTNDSLAASGPTQAYAIGLNVGTHRGLRVVSHGGSWAGYRAHFMRFPDQRFAVATLCNLTTSGPDSLARQVAAVYLGDKLQPDVAAEWAAALTAAPRVERPAAYLAPLAGVWRNVERGEVRRTRVAGDTLLAVGGGEPARLVPIDGDRFRLDAGAERAEVRFEDVDGEAGRPARMVVRTGGLPSEVVTFTRVEATPPTAAQLAEYAGVYRNDEVEATQTWKVEKGELVAYSPERRLGALVPTYRDGFLRGGNVIDVARDGRGRVTGFVVEAGRVRHLRFTRVR